MRKTFYFLFLFIAVSFLVADPVSVAHACADEAESSEMIILGSKMHHLQHKIIVITGLVVLTVCLSLFVSLLYRSWKK